MTDRPEQGPARRSSSSPVRFWRGQVWPRRREIVREWPPYVAALAFAITSSLLAPVLPAGSLTIVEVATTGLTFASIAVGACATAVVLALGLPGGDRLRRWAKHDTKADMNALSDLVFALVWAALAQLMLIVVCVVAMLFGGEGPLAPSGLSWTHWIGLAVGLLVFYYALFELFVVVNTLSQVGAVIAEEERRAADGPKEGQQ